MKKIDPIYWFIAILVGVVVLGIAVRSWVHSDSHQQGANVTQIASTPADIDTSDPAAARIKSDVEAPLQFAVNASGFNLMENHSIGAPGGAVLVSGASNINPSNIKCYLPAYEFKLAPNANWMAGSVLYALVGSGAVTNNSGNNYSVTSVLSGAQTMSFQEHACGWRWTLYDLGHFAVTKLDLINEFEGPDQQTQSTTKVRSYKVRVEFQPSSKLAAAVPNGVYGHFEWTVALERNPMTKDWDYYKLDGGNWYPN